MPKTMCQSCLHSYDGSDGVLRCRVHPQAMPCFEVLVENCKRYIYEPGTDAEGVRVEGTVMQQGKLW